MTTFLVNPGQTLSGVTLGSGDEEDVFLGGTAVSTIINGGNQIIELSGTASNTTINGGTEHVLAGGTATGMIFAGPAGTLVLDQPESLTGTISGWQIGDIIDIGGRALTSAV